MARDKAFRQAEEQITEALYSEAKVISLAGLGLSEIPEALNQFKFLEVLDLFSNELTVLPEWIGNLTHLRELHFGSNQLTVLPEWIGNLTQLQILHIGSNQLTVLPESLQELTRLETLNLSFNRLTTLLETLGQLTQLQSLNISHNKLEKYPKSLNNLIRLQVLNLSDNQLTALPESIGKLASLQLLHLSNNRLTALPESIGQLTRVPSLDLSHNQLTALPESIGRLSHLESLDLSNNRLTALPESIGQLTRVPSLDLSHNQLTALPESIGQLTQLESLDLSNNQLTALPESIGQLKHLQSLNLSNNLLAALPESIGQLSQLQSIDFSLNHLESLPKSLSVLTTLKVVLFPSNDLNNTGLLMLCISKNQMELVLDSLERLTKLRALDLSNDELTAIPEELSHLKELQLLNLSNNQLTMLPESLGNIEQLRFLDLSSNELAVLPRSISKLTQLESLDLFHNQLQILPEWVGQIRKLKTLTLDQNQLSDIPASLSRLDDLSVLRLQTNLFSDLDFESSFSDLFKEIFESSSTEENSTVNNLLNLEHVAIPSQKNRIADNPLNPELAEAYKQGLEAVKAYLRAKAGAQITLNEAKLILVGEGEVGKTCLMDALLDKKWQEHPSTHGIEIQQVKVTDGESQKEITLNGWDFGGQRVYRPTHQLFFSAPAVYLVVWKPREGPQQGFVKEWIQLVKRREPSAKIIVVATHGGPQQRQPDIDRQELWDLFGKETVVDFFFVDSKPDENGNRKGIDDLKLAIAHVAAQLPEVGRSVPKSFQDVRQALQERHVPYLPLDEVLAICRAHNMDDEIARLYITISHRLGHLTHYQNDPALRDIVILRPDWLASAMSYVLDDEYTRNAHGLVKFSRLSQLWDDPSRPAEARYSKNLHKIFLRLMERFDLSYRVAGLSPNEETNPVSLIAQLVPDNTPEEKDFEKAWLPEITSGDIQQTQICRIVDAQNGQSANAEGLFFQLIVRLHRYSLGRLNYNDSVHWQRGLVLDDDYNGRALLRHVGNDVHITVRAPYPERFLAMLTEEVKYLVESFWEGLRCDVMVPCIKPCGRYTPGTGLFEVDKLIDSKRKNRSEFPCPVCNEWQNIDYLLRNAPAAQPDATAVIISEFAEVKAELAKARQQLSYQGEKMMGRFDRLDDRTRRILSLVDNAYNDLLQVLTDEAKEGPRLFSLVPVKRSTFNPKQWASEKFHLILWCEHSRLPLPILNSKNSQKGIYELELTREWFKKAAPLLKVMTSTLSLVLPVAASGAKLVIDKTIYDPLEDYLNFGKEVIDATLSGSEKASAWIDIGDSVDLPHGIALRAENATLRELHALLKAKDPGFGGLVRVMNKRQEFLWVHEKFAGEY
jgi:Leucine-rich repeat (LRR) protein